MDKIIQKFINCQMHDKVVQDFELVNKLVQLDNIRFEHGDYVSYIPQPYCISKVKYDKLSDDAINVFNALNTIVTNYRSDKKIKNYFKHLDSYQVFLNTPHIVDPIISIARFDLMETKSGDFKIIEPNTCCPGGMIWTAIFYDYFKKTNIYKTIANSYDIFPQALHQKKMIYEYLIQEYEKHFTKEDSYFIAIADTNFAPMETELFELRDNARKLGYKSEKIHIQDIEYKNGFAYYKNHQIHILYQFLDILFKGKYAQITNKITDISGYMQALHNRSMLTVNPFAPIFISEDKSSLALLLDPDFQAYFSEQEKQAIKKLVPPTYRMKNTDVLFNGDTVNLTKLLKAHKNDFIIKAQMESMGREIYFGKNMSDKEWHNLIKRTLDKMYIAQQFIESKLSSIYNPLSTNEDKMYYTLALSIVGGKIKGLFNRLSNNMVTNVAQGGAVQNVLVVKEK